MSFTMAFLYLENAEYEANEYTNAVKELRVFNLTQEVE